MVQPFPKQEVKVQLAMPPYQHDKQGTLEEADNLGIRLVLRDRPNHKMFIPWSSVLSVEHNK